MNRVIYLAGGCFWNVQDLLNQLPGIISTKAGYANSLVDMPDYQSVCSGEAGAYECVKTTWDDEVLDTRDLMYAYFAMVEESEEPDKKQYNPGIWWDDEATKELVAPCLNGRRVQPEFGPLVNFHAAEGYHQNYLNTHPWDRTEKKERSHRKIVERVNSLPSEKLDLLQQKVKEMGIYAKEHQKGIGYRSKEDGTPVTDVDLYISRTLINFIGQTFPDCAIISEEHTTRKVEAAPFTFVIDPIDGTDMYRWGMPNFAISVGILDSDNSPEGAAISFPRFGICADSTLVRLDPGCEVRVNSEILIPPVHTELREITTGSNGKEILDFTGYSGKTRTLGSTILHLILPALTPGIQGDIETRGYIWDIASSHAVLKSLGMDIFTKQGEHLIYDEALLNRERYTPPIYAGPENIVKEMIEVIPTLN